MNKKNCVVIFNNSWGEVDFILPVLKDLKKKGFKIYASFKSENLLKQKTKYQDLYKLLTVFTEIINPKKNKDENKIFKILFNYFLRPKYFFMKIKNFKFSKINQYIKNSEEDNTKLNINYFLNNKINLDYLLCADFDADNYLWIKYFKNKFFFLFPHALTLRGNHLNKYRNINKKVFSRYFKDREYKLKKYPKGTILFACNLDELNYFKNFTPKNIKLKIIGFPRLSNNWLSFLRKKQIYKKYFLKKNKSILLIIGKSSYLGNNEIIKKIKDVIKISEKFGYDLIIKNHPRNILNINRFKKFSDKINIYETNESISSTLNYCDIMILTSKSGVCLEGVYQNKIVVEYYRYNRFNTNNNAYEYLINGNYYSIYKLYKLAIPCENIFLLNKFFSLLKINKNFKSQILRDQSNGLKKIGFYKETINYSNYFN